jgi:hypothetical protein
MTLDIMTNYNVKTQRIRDTKNEPQCQLQTFFDNSILV